MKDTRSNYQKFMSYFPGNNTFQLFADRGADVRPLVIHDADPCELSRLNDKGYGVFIAVNKTDGQGRKASNIVKVRAVFADMDGVSPGAMMDDMPHLAVQSSPGKFHGYWFVDDDFPLQGFCAVQKGIAFKYGSDPVVHDLPRVMRIPGFMHQKNDPFPVTVVWQNEDQRKISYNECVEKWPPEPVKKWTAKKDYVKSDSSIDAGASVEEMLERFGWKHCHSQRWTRPGKDYGVSGEILGSGLFYVYTSESALPPGKACDAFEILCQYDWSGNKSECAKFLMRANK